MERLTKPTCYHDGCDKPRARKHGKFNSRWCAMHASRRIKYGVTWALVKKVGPYGAGSISKDGYKIVWKGARHYMAHRLVWETANGPIPRGHVIHHKDGNKLNNSLDNLECTTQLEHMKMHWPNQRWVECL